MNIAFVNIAFVNIAFVNIAFVNVAMHVTISKTTEIKLPQDRYLEAATRAHTLANRIIEGIVQVRGDGEI